ncbi:MAG: hypothetical protein SGI73_16465, partial [Chloroflexota bacterium]|nr:hypothetical protein [Chloroflexota bacterium]
MRSLFQRSFCALVLLTLLAAAPAFAQDVPTSAPSATPIGTTNTALTPTLARAPQTATLAATLDALATPAPTIQRNVAPFNPLTQADLSVLTGNVQRPNAIAYLDGLLYIACTGDSTIYETDSVSGQTRTYIWGVMNTHSLIAEADSSGALTLWIPDYDSNSLVRVTRGSLQRVARDLAGPWGITDVNQDYFLVTNVRNNSVTQIDRAGEVNTLIEGLAA